MHTFRSLAVVAREAAATEWRTGNPACQDGGTGRIACPPPKAVVTHTVDGQLTTRRRRVMKILTPAGRELAYAAAYFKSGKVLSMRGWVIDPKGEVHDVREREAAKASATSVELNLPPGVAFTETLVNVGRASARPARAEVPAPSSAAWEIRDAPAIDEEPRMPEARSLAGWRGALNDAFAKIAADERASAVFKCDQWLEASLARSSRSFRAIFSIPSLVMVGMV
jgi:hypothetical protein